MIKRSRIRTVKQTCQFCAVLLALAVFCPLRSLGLGFLIPNQDAEAVGRGNAFAATADNPSAIYYNPAGISQIPGFAAQIGALDYMGIYAHYTSPAGAETRNDAGNIIVPQIFLTFSLTNLPLSFGLGEYSPFGLGMEWPQNSNFRSLAINARMEYFTLNPIVAWTIIPHLSVAAGPTFNYSQIKITRGLFTPADYLEIKGNDVSYGATVGLLWQPWKQWSFGVSYRSPSTMNYHGTATYSGGPFFNSSAGTTAELPFPQSVSGGISFRPTPKWNLEFDVDWINWNTVNAVTLNGTKNLSFGFLTGNLQYNLYWQNSWQFKGGVTRYFDKWFVSAGCFYSSQTTSSAYFTPAIPDTDLYVGTLGFGYKATHWNFALTGEIIAGPSRTITADGGNTNPLTGQSAAGTYRLFSPALLGSVGYRF